MGGSTVCVTTTHLWPVFTVHDLNTTHAILHSTLQKQIVADKPKRQWLCTIYFADYMHCAGSTFTCPPDSENTSLHLCNIIPYFILQVCIV